ncbi:tripartite tricarboxylate transporter substrate binding protein [Cupriavidus consociatus]|uniref:tripartite tricarboxylate transporter substrate binding protein n=1 Tax=Cupriavidus consociatus TaxID=2821357 RepID=UPI001AE2605F|nr:MULTISPECIES: tripartite tricarboxylate transporter substrate binding protein [unclassified Cupriavidus]MBP0621232.1 tripartite tricarboxylate transporter substrate binding protein [Cupriavidus sp. LEh25]MDK2657904.1 tripartite tricarboxylate transporter substrate binding protein [Cupriavidus sp. LEh21]
MHSIKAMAAAIGAAAILPQLLQPASAQAAESAATWPSRPITIVVTYPPGGGADLMARLIAPGLGRELGQSVVVENRPGAGGQIGAAYVAKAAPDGYTVMVDASSYAVNPSLYARLPYDPARAFKPVGVLARYPNVLVATASFPAAKVGDVLAMAKQKPGSVAFASSGNGSAQHLAGVLFEQRAGVDLLHVPYKGGGPAMTDVIAGQVPLFFANVASSLQHIKAGKLKPLAVTSHQRTSALPGVPTMQEAGVPGYEVYEWNAAFLPAATPDPIVAKFAEALQKVMHSPETRQRVTELGGEVVAAPPAQAQQFIDGQARLWAKVIKDGNVKPE